MHGGWHCVGKDHDKKAQSDLNRHVQTKNYTHQLPSPLTDCENRKMWKLNL